jgi:dTDP-4-dehydrorhamnose reductase
MRILVTGSNGLLGRKLVDLIRKEPNTELLATTRASLDVTNSERVNSTILEFKPDVVINAAAMTQVDQCEVSQDECWKQNVSSVKNLVAACEKNNVYLVHISTDFIFDGKQGPLDESAIPAPVNFYGESKLEGEKIILNSNCKASIIRTVLVYGVTSDMSRSNIVLWVKKSLEGRKPITVVTDQFRTPTLAEDLAMACVLAAKKKATGVFHVSGAEMMTPYDIAIRTAEIFGLDKTLIKPSTNFVQPAKRPLKTGFIVDKAKRELGYNPHSFDEGLKIVKQQLLDLTS